LTVLLFAITKIGIAQSAEGVITYNVKMNMYRMMTAEQEAYKSMVPEFSTHREQLFFTSKESSYRPLKNDGTQSSNGMTVTSKTAWDETYHNFTAGRSVSTAELGGNEYKINEDIIPPSWRFEDSIKTLLGYRCKKASFIDDKKKQVVAWYTEKIPVAAGPENVNSLPGVILEVNIHDGERVIAATSVDLRALKKDEMKVPENGQQISRAEFNKMLSNLAGGAPEVTNH